MPRIISGLYRRRRLEGPDETADSRPYLDRIKESVFNQLGDVLDEARVLDLFAGVGTVGLEAASREAVSVLMVEKSRKTFAALQRNIEALGCEDVAIAMHGDALGPACLRRAPQPLDLVFVDPPYGMMHDADHRQRVFDQMTECRRIMRPGAFLVLRTPLDPKHTDHAIEGLDGPEGHVYGKSGWVLFYQKPRGEENDDESTADEAP